MEGRREGDEKVRRGVKEGGGEDEREERGGGDEERKRGGEV